MCQRLNADLSACVTSFLTCSAPFVCMFVVICRGTLQVAVDGAHVLEYRHRVALQRVDTLCISGKVKVMAVGILPSLVSLTKLSRWLLLD